MTLFWQVALAIVASVLAWSRFNYLDIDDVRSVARDLRNEVTGEDGLLSELDAPTTTPPPSASGTELGIGVRRGAG